MSNKSLFEKLFEEVMENDEAALGIDGGDSAGDMGGAEDFGGGDEGMGDEVTLTMDKATAEKLMDLLSAALGGGLDEEGEGEGDEFGGGEEGGGEEGGFGGGMGDEAAEEDDEDEDAEEEDKDEDAEEEEEGSLKESPQAQYKPFTNKGEQMTKSGNRKVGGVASNVSGAGKAEKTAQTQGTAHYMPHNDNGSKMQQKGNMKVAGARAANPSGPGKSVFHP
jgi:hypothetical protein